MPDAGTVKVPDRELDPLQVCVGIAQYPDALVNTLVPVNHRTLGRQGRGGGDGKRSVSSS